MDTTHDDQQAQPILLPIVAEQPAMIPGPLPEQQQTKYVCDICNKGGFRSKQAARGHKSIHSRNNTIVTTSTSSTTTSTDLKICLVCGMEFDSNESLLGHLKSGHYEDMAIDEGECDHNKGGFDLSKKLSLSWSCRVKRKTTTSNDETSSPSLDSSPNNLGIFGEDVKFEREDYSGLLLMAEVCTMVASGTPLLLAKDDPFLPQIKFVQIGCKRRRLDDKYVRIWPAAPVNRDDENHSVKNCCKFCNRQFSSHQALGGHMTGHKLVKNSSLFRDHTQNNGECNNSEQQKVYGCKDCDRKFTSSQALGGHRSSPLCKQNIIINNNNSANVNVVENKDAIVVENKDVIVVEARGQDEKVHKCNECKLCNKDFKSHQALGGHLSRHSKHKMVDNTNQDRTNSADTSTGGAENKNEQQRHKLYPTLSTHPCTKCEKTFLTGQALGGHQRVHFKPPTEAPPAETNEQSNSAPRRLNIDLNALPTIEEDDAISYNTLPHHQN